MDSSDEEQRGRRGRGQAGSDSDGPGFGLGFGRRKRRQSDEGLLGVFADGGSSDEGDGRRGRRGKKGRGKTSAPSHTTPVTFVQGATMQKTQFAETTRKDNASDDEVDPRWRLSGAAPNLPAVEEGPKLPSKNSMSFNKMGETYGKGFAMLQRMGFTGGGLGARNDGIANPIEVVKRKTNQGLQDEGEKVEQDPYGQELGKDRTAIEELLNPKPKKSDEPGPADAWRKGVKVKQRRITYKSAEEVAGDRPSTMRIIDMRGPEVRVASSFSELAASISSDTVQSLKELRHNTRLLVAKYEDKIRALNEKRRYYEDMLIQVAKETEQLDAARSFTEEDAGHCREVVEAIEDLREQQDEGTISLRELGSAFVELHAKHPKEFKALSAFDAAVALGVPVAKRELATWRPLEKPNDGLLPLAPWRYLASSQGSTHEIQVITTLCDAALLPRMRSALTDRSVREFEPCIQLFEQCRKELPAAVVETMVAQVVLPRLKVEVEAWDPRVDPMPIHVWVHPWLPILGDRLICLWTPIRFKLSKCLEQWNPKDHSAHGVILPWQNVFDPANWEPLAEKVLVRLEAHVSNMQVKPNGQDVQPVKDLLIWQDVLPLASLARVLEAALFPQWHAALRAWLRVPGCNYGEVLQWYQGWKTLLPDALREEGLVQKQLAHGLEVMKHCMSGGSTDDPTVAESEQAPKVSAKPSNGKSLANAAPVEPVSVEEISLSLSDYLSDVASDNGLVFHPKVGKLHLGMQVYQFGSASVCLDKDLVYIPPKGGEGDWKPASFDEVLKLALAKKPQRQ